jgi:hypothetical protein
MTGITKKAASAKGQRQQNSAVFGSKPAAKCLDMADVITIRRFFSEIMALYGRLSVR